jgi:hypothetical protein
MPGLMFVVRVSEPGITVVDDENPNLLAMATVPKLTLMLEAVVLVH